MTIAKWVISEPVPEVVGMQINFLPISGNIEARQGAQEESLQVLQAGLWSLVSYRTQKSHCRITCSQNSDPDYTGDGGVTSKHQQGCLNVQVSHLITDLSNSPGR